MNKSFDIAVVGAGIVGLAHAYMAAKKGLRVAVFEREQFAVGASVRNFGLVWPIGQAPGVGLDRALRSRQHWLEVAASAGIWINRNGSLHLAYHDDEWTVINEFFYLNSAENYDTELLSPLEVVRQSPGVRKEGLRGAMLSKTECTVYSRQAIRQLPVWLRDRFGVEFFFGKAISAIEGNELVSGNEKWRAQHIFVCSGNDFETLYPEWFAQQPLTKCKLQMLKGVPNKPLHLGPSLCAGLTLRHYAAFEKCATLKIMSDRYDRETSAYHENGIHVLVSQNALGELIIGDSHHYAKTHEPFDYDNIDQLILSYLSTFLQTEDITITERWHGIYPRYAAGIDMILKPTPVVTVVNGLGGAGMTLSFGLAEEVVGALT